MSPKQLPKSLIQSVKINTISSLTTALIMAVLATAVWMKFDLEALKKDNYRVQILFDSMDKRGVRLRDIENSQKETKDRIASVENWRQYVQDKHPDLAIQDHTWRERAWMRRP